MAGNVLEKYCDSTTVHGFKYLVGQRNIFQKIFWAAMIILSIFCTLLLIASLIDQISRNPVTIHRDDTPIDITKIPFPAFTICNIGNITQTEISAAWLSSYLIPILEVTTKLGKCITSNFCDPKYFLHGGVDVGLVFQDFYEQDSLPENQTQPYLTTSLDGGIDIIVYPSDNEISLGITNNHLLLFMIHSPYEFPTGTNQIFYLVDEDKDTFFVTPQLNRIDDTMIGMEPHERNCFFPHEKKLTLYKVYNEASCKAECKSNFVASECGCVPEYLIANASIPICNSTSKTCANEAEMKIEDEFIGNCDCLPSCEHLKYFVERTRNDFTNPHPEFTAYDSSYVRIRFKSGDHFPIVRRKHYTVTEIFAFTGGLLGLFLGISVVSFAELVNLLLHPFFKMFSAIFCIRKRSTFTNPKRNRLPERIDKVRSYFSLYLKESSIHSFNFIADATNCVEQIFWFLAFSISMTGCVLMILQLYRTMDFKAVTFVIDDQLMHVSEIPFPAVTIFASFPTIFGMSALETVQHPASRIAAFALITEVDHITAYENIFNFTDHERYIVDEIKQMSKVEWFRGQKGSFGKLSSVPFAETLTKRGMAFTFNILDFHDFLDTQTVSSDFQFHRNVVSSDHLKTRRVKFPWHASVLDSLNLEMAVATDVPLHYAEAFAVHPTDELPLMLLPENVFEFGGGKNLEVLITPSVTRSDESLKILEPSDRSCYFDGERKLRFFKVYTKHNCKIECFSNYSQNLCNCVWFDILREPDTKVCGIAQKDLKCQYGLHSVLKDYGPTGELASCNCLSPCNSVSYNLVVRDSKFREKELDNITQISFKIADTDFNPMRRRLRFTVTDFFTYVGGVLGLFAGISMLSLFEIFYFFTLRLSSNFWAPKEAPKHDIIIVAPAKIIQ